MAYPFERSLPGAYRAKSEARIDWGDRTPRWKRPSRGSGQRRPGVRRRAASDGDQTLIFEPLEPRLLLSADLMPFSIDMMDQDVGNDLTLRFDDLFQSLRLFDNRNDGALVNERAVAETDEIRVTGTSGDDRLTLEASGPAQLNLDFIFDGGQGNDWLTLNLGSTLGLNMSFAGGEGRDGVAATQDTDFDLDDDALVLGGDTIALSDVEEAELTGGSSANTLDASGFSGDAQLLGLDGADTLTGGAGDDHLSGGAGDDVLVASEGDDVYDGGDGNDSLVGGDGDNIWEITGTNAGTLNGRAFVDVENLVGGAGNDEFIFHPGGSLSGSIDGGGGTNTLDYGARSAGVSVDLSSGAATGTGGVAGIDNVVGGAGDDVVIGGAGDNVLAGGGGADRLAGGGGSDAFDGGTGEDTLVGADAAAVWEIAALDAGTLNGQAFANIETLLGGAGDDSFVFLPDGRLSGTIDGDGGTNTLDYRALATGVAVSFVTGYASGTGGVRNLQNVRGGAGDDELEGDDGANLLDGGAGDDTLRVTGGADQLIGGAGEDSVAGPAADSTWIVDGAGAGSLGETVFSEIENLGGAADNEDTFVFEDGGSLAGLIDGGDGGYDTLVVNFSSVDSLVYDATGPDSGSVAADSNVIAFVGLEPVTISGPAETLTVTASDSDDDLVLEVDPADSSRLTLTSSGTIETPEFAMPMTSLTIELNSGNDILTIGDVGTFDLGKLTVDGDGPGAAGTDMIRIARDTDMVLTDSDLMVGGDTIGLVGVEAAELTGGGSANALDASGFTGDVTLSGQGGDDTLVGGSGNDQLFGGPGNDTLDGGPGNDLLIGGADDDTYRFGAGFGLDTVTDSGGANDTLDFSAFTGALTFSVGALGEVTVTGDDGSSVTLSASTAANIENIVGLGPGANATVDLSKADSALQDGLQRLVDWAAELATFDNLGAELPIIGGNVGVGVGTALDIAEALEQLRLEVKEYFDTNSMPTTDGLIAALSSKFETGKTVKHLGAAIISEDLSPSISKDDEFEFSLDVDGETATIKATIEVANPDIATLVSALANRLPTNLADKLRIVATDDGRLAFEVIGSDVDSFQLTPVSVPAIALGYQLDSAGGVTLGNVQDILEDLGDLTVKVAPGITVSVAFDTMGVPELRIGVAYDADRSSSFGIDLGSEAEELGLNIDGEATLDMASHLDFDFALGLKLDAAPTAGDDFFLDVDTLSVTAQLNAAGASNITGLDVNVGFLGAELNGTIALDAALQTIFGGSPTAEGLTFDQLDPVSIASLVGLDQPTNSFTIDLNVLVDPGLGGFAPAGVKITAGTAGTAGSDLFAGRDIDLEEINFTDLANFSDLNASTFLGLLGQVRDWLDGLRESDLLADFPIPFAEGSLSSVLDFADAFEDALLFDVGDATPLGFSNEESSAGGVLLTGDTPDILESIASISFKLFLKVGDDAPAAVTVTTTPEDDTDDKLTLDGLIEDINAALVGLAVQATKGGADNDLVQLSASNTGDALEIVPGVERLLDGDNAPTFDTAQELADKLFDILGISANASYSVADQELTYVIDVSNDLLDVSLPIDFSLDLSPLGEISTVDSPSVRLDGTAGLSLTLGLDLGPADPSKNIADDTDLVDLNGVEVIGDVVKAEPALTAANPPSAALTGAPTLNFASSAALAGNPELTFADNGSADTITRQDGSWIDEGFEKDRSITVSGSGGNDGTYTISSVEADVLTLTSADQLMDEGLVQNVSVTMDGTISRGAGPGNSWIEDGFQTGQIVMIGGTDDNNGTFLIMAVTDEVLALDARAELEDESLSEDVEITGDAVVRLSGDASFEIDAGLTFTGDLTFADNGTNDTITRDDGSSWSDDNFQAGMSVAVAGTTDNNKIYRIASIDGAVLTLVAADIATGETAIGASLAAFSQVTVLANPDSNRPFLTATSDNTNPFDLSLDVNAALEDAGLAGLIEAELDGTRLVLTAIDPAIAGFVLTTSAGDPAATQLGFGSVQTSNDTDLRIYTRDGHFHDIALDGAATIGNVIAAINVQTSGAVTAEVDPDTLNSLRLTDTTAPSGSDDDVFRVEAINGSPSAIKLGILRADPTTDVNGDEIVDGVIEGDAIGGTTLADRFFVENAEVKGTLTLDTPAGVDISGNFGFVQVNLDGSGSLSASLSSGLIGTGPANRLTLSELNDGLGDIGSIVEAPVLSGPSLTGVALTFTDNGTTDTITRDDGGSWLDDGFRAGQVITVSGTTSNNTPIDTYFRIASIGGTGDSVLTLVPEDALASESAVIGAAVSAAPGQVSLGVSLSPDFPGIALGSDPKVLIDLLDFGDPFAETVFASPGLTFVDAETFTLAGDQTANVAVGASVAALLAGSTVDTRIANVEFNTDADLTTVTLLDDGLDSSLSEVTIATPVAPEFDFTFPDLGNLVNFDDLGFSQIIDGLIELSDFLGEFEQFGFLSDPIPLINLSVNDLLGFADRFDAAVQNAQDDPAGTLQGLEAKLREAFGLPAEPNPDDPFSIGLSLVSDDGSNTDPDDDLDILRLTLSLGTEFSEALGIDLADLVGDTGDIFSLMGSADLVASASIQVGLDLGIGLGNNPGELYVFDGDLALGEGTGLSGSVSLTGGLDFGAALELPGLADLFGPIGVNISGGGAELFGGFDVGLDKAVFTELSTGERFATAASVFDVPIGDIVAEGSKLTGFVKADLPVYFPTEDNLVGNIKLFSGSNFDGTGSGTDIPVSLTDAVSNLNVAGVDDVIAGLNVFDLSNLDLFDSILLAVDGIDLFLDGLQSVLDGEVFGLELPLIGDGLSDGARFIEDLQDDVVDPFRNAVETADDLRSDVDNGDTNPISKILFDVLEPTGLLLVDVNGETTRATQTGLDEGLFTLGQAIGLTTNLADDQLPTFDELFIQWNVRLGQAPTAIGTNLDLDLGIPGLGFEANGPLGVELGWELALGFGLSGTEGFYFDIDNGGQAELMVDVDVVLPDSLTGQLAFLQLNALNVGSALGATFAIDVGKSGNQGNASRLGFTELGNLDLTPQIAANATADFDLTLQLNSDLIPGASAVFPTLKSDFLLEWALGDRVTDPDNKVFEDLSSITGSVIQAGLETVAFTDVELDLGLFISDFVAPILEQVQSVTEPVQPVVDILTTPLPVISDLGPPVTLLDLAGIFGKVNPAFLRSVADIITLVNAIPTNVSSLMIPFGDFVVFEKDKINPDLDLSDPDANLSGIEMPDSSSFDFNSELDKQPAGSTKNFTKKLTTTGGFSFPILTSPTEAFNLLLGKDVTLLAYDMGALELDLSYSQFFPIFGPLGASITGRVTANIDFAFGFDTFGISQFAASDFRNPELIFNGFYVSDNPTDATGAGPDLAELVLGLSLSAAAEVNLGIARGGAGGGVFGQVNFDLFDPDRDGRVRIGEIVGNIANEITFGSPALAPLAIFDISGEVFARLFAFLKIDLLFFSVDKTFNITPKIVLASFETDFFRPPKLASELPDGVLQLNMGEFAAERLNGDLRDLSEEFFVRDAGQGFVEVWAPGLGINSGNAQKYRASSTIIALGGDGDDVIDLSGVGLGTTNQGLTFELEGGVGNDIVKAGASIGVATRVSVIRGDAGDDHITGSGGRDQIFGDAGNDTIYAMGGADLVFGDAGRISGDALRARLGLSDGDDTIQGGAGSDIIFGGGGADEIDGDGSGTADGGDTILGDGGLIDRVLSVAGDDVVPLSGRLDGNATFELSFGGSSVTVTVLAADTADNFSRLDLADDINDALADIPDPADMTAKLDDRFRVEVEGSLLVLSAVDDDISAFTLDVVPGSIAETQLGFSTTIVDVPLEVIERTDSGASSGSDTIRGNGGADRIFAGLGDDTVEGGAGEDIIFGQSGFDTIDAGGDDDIVFGDDGAVTQQGARVAAGGESDSIKGGAGDDLLFGGDGGDLIEGGLGDDEIFGGAGADRLFGNLFDPRGTTQADGDDRIFGQGGGDRISGGGGNDFLNGGAGNDIIFGDSGGLVDGLFDPDTGGFGEGGSVDPDGDDALIGGVGSDQLFGEGQSDVYRLQLQGASNSSLIKVSDSGASGIDLLLVNGTLFDDQFLLRANAGGTLAFVALINNDGEDVERINYNNLERISVSGGLGDDRFAVDDTAAEVTLNGDVGEDSFQIGQLFRSARAGESGEAAEIAEEDFFLTIETTRGFLSNGVSAPLVANGGVGEDEFIVFHNLATLQLNGGPDDDSFSVRAFALAGSQEPQRQRTDISGGAGADLIEYAVNAPVNIDGGDGLDRVNIIGTEFGDDFVITEDGVFGAGLNVNFVNIEALNVDGAEGDDRFFIESTSEKFITEIAGGLGSDTFNFSGDTPPVVSNDLRGHSGIITHSVESLDPRFDGLKLDGISANVADNDEAFVVVTPSDGSTIITEGGASDSYTVVLTRQPTTDILVNVLAPVPTQQERELRSLAFRVDSPSQTSVTTPDGTGLILRFTPENWFEAQTVNVLADSAEKTDLAGAFTRPELGDDSKFSFDDDAVEGLRFAVINHTVTAEAAAPLTGVANSVVTGENDPNSLTDDSATFTPDDLVGRKIEITDGAGVGQVRFIVSNSDTTITIEGEWDPDALPDDTSRYQVRFDDAIVGRPTAIDNANFTFTDANASFPDEGDGIAGAKLLIVGGEGAGQERLILSNTAKVLTLNGAWSELPDETNIYRIERFDGIAVRSLEVEINDNDRPGLIVEQDGVDTSVIEGSTGETIEIRLNQVPTSGAVTVQLNAGAQLALSGATLVGGNQLVFDATNWNTPQIVSVDAADDLIREGFHNDLITFDVITGGGDQIASGIVDSFDITEDDDPTFLLGLTQLPIASTVSVMLDDENVPSVDDAVAGDELRFEVVQNKVVFFNEASEFTEVVGKVEITYDTVEPGFESAEAPPILVRIADDDAVSVVIRESGGSTDVIEFTPKLPETSLQQQLQFNNVFSPNELTFEFEASAVDTFGGATLGVLAFADLGASTEFLSLSAEGIDLGNLFVNDGLDLGLVRTSVELSQTDLETLADDGKIVFTVTPSDAVDPTGGPFFFNFSAIRLDLTLVTNNIVGAEAEARADDALFPRNDSYEVVLSAKPTEDVFVTITPEITKTTRTGGIRHDIVQLVVSSDELDAVANADGTVTLKFTEDNWDAPQIVKVSAVDDQFVDGGDTKVFAPGPDTLSKILGPVFIDGEGGEGSLEGLGNVVLLPGETNLRDSTGDVLDLDDRTLTVALQDLVDSGIVAGAGEVSELLARTAEITRGGAQDQFRLIIDAVFVPADAGGPDRVELLLNEAFDVAANDPAVEYAITTESLNFFVDETEQVDFMFLFDNDSPADSSGVIDSTRITGFNMGPDIEIGGILQPGGITYNDLEVVVANLGSGNNNVDVRGTHVRPDGFQTWTILNTGGNFGTGNDHVTINLKAEETPILAGGVSEAGSSSVTVSVTGALPADGELSGQFIRLTDGANTETRRIVGNQNDDGLLRIIVEDPWDSVPSSTATAEVFEPADGAFAVDTQSGDDIVDASGSSLPLVIFGGEGADDITGGSGDDIIFGDKGRVDYFDENGKVVTRLGSAPDPITGPVTAAQGVAESGGADTLTDLDANFAADSLAGLRIVITEGAGAGQIRTIAVNDAMTITVDSAWSEAPDGTSNYRVVALSAGNSAGGDPAFLEDPLANFPPQDDGLNGLIGLEIVINNGTGFLQDPRIITGNDATRLELNVDWDVLPDATSDYRISTLPEDQTDGVVRGAGLIATLDAAAGGDDTIRGGEGEDTILGGAGGDTITGSGGDDLVLGDQGRVDLEQAGAFGPEGPAIGDSAPTRLAKVESLADDSDGVDDITAAQGRDIVFGGGAGDMIDVFEANDLNGDIILGDHGIATFDDNEILDRIESTSPTDGGNDTITGGIGPNIILGGIGDDTIEAGGDTSPDVILGDNGLAVFLDGKAQLVETFSPENGGEDEIRAGDGPNILIGGSKNDDIFGGEADDVILGDNGRAVFTSAGVLISILTTDFDSDPEDFGGSDFIEAGNGIDVVFGGTKGDTILAGGTDALRDIVLGDNGSATFTTAGVLTRIETTDPGRGGNDDITTGNGPDVVLGGAGNDTILAATAGSADDLTAVLALVAAGNFDAIAPGDDAADVILGDNGIANFTGPTQLLDIQSSDPDFGGDDIIVSGNGPDVIFGGSNAPVDPAIDDDQIVPGDIIVAGGDIDDEDIVAGDNAKATFQGTGVFDDGEEFSTLSFNFNASSSNTSNRNVTGEAGAVRAENWNNLIGDGPQTFGNDAEEIVVFDDGLIAPDITVEWGEDLDTDPDDTSEDSHSQITTGDDQNKRLFEGYLYSSNNETLGVNVGGLDRHYQSLDLYLYIDADNSKSSSGSSLRRITVGDQTLQLNDPDGNTFDGDYVEATAGDPLGNYVVFRGLDSGDLVDGKLQVRIEAEPGSSSNRPALNGMQIVGQSNPIDRIESIFESTGGDDLIFTGGGADIAIGGQGSDRIETFGPSVRGSTDPDIVAGDNARATFMLGELREFRTTAPDQGGGDLILTGNGEDVVLGGIGDDNIRSGAEQPFDNGDVTVLSVNFHSDVDKGVVTGVAGAVQADRWNNLVGDGPRIFGNDPGETLVLDDGSVATDIEMTWGEDLETRFDDLSEDTHSQIDPDTQNERLSEGYLHASTSRTIGVDVNGLAGHFVGAYDVYVYIDADDSKSRSGESLRRLSIGATTLLLDDPDGNTFAGEFVESGAGGLGNYVVFRNVIGDSFSLRIDDQGTSSANRPALAALQIVGGPDKDGIVVGGDFDTDAVVGDNGVARFFDAALYEIKSSDTALGGDDSITTGEDGDLVIGGSGGDAIDGQAGDDLLLGDNARLILFDGEVVGLNGIDGDDDDDDDDDDDFDPFDVLGIQLLSGQDGADTIAGGTDDDLSYGQGGNDSFVFGGLGLGNDGVVEAGNSDPLPNDPHDRLDFSTFGASIDVELWEDDRQTVGGGSFQGDINLRLTLYSGTAVEGVVGTIFDDDIDGNSRNNTLIGGDGEDRLDGESGDDLLLGGGGADDIDGDSGSDLIDGGDGDDRIFGGDGDDDDDDDDDDDGDPKAHNLLLGGDGNDWIRGGNGADLIDGEAGDDDLRGRSGDDIILGGSGDDHIHGDGGRDIIEGGAGDDDIHGISSRDQVEQDTGAGLLGLLDPVTAFAMDFGYEGFEFVDPSASGDDRPLRAWVSGFLAGVPDSDFLLASAPAERSLAAAGPSDVDLAAVLAAAKDRLAAVHGLEASAFDGVSLALTDLPGLALGKAEGQALLLDANAAGHGWFVDPTPRDDGEFLGSDSGSALAARADGPAAGRMDLMTAVMHELGHIVGQDHVVGGQDVMSGSLTPGFRRLPQAADGVSQQPAEAASIHLFDDAIDDFYTYEEYRLLERFERATLGEMTASRSLANDWMFVGFDGDEEPPALPVEAPVADGGAPGGGIAPVVVTGSDGDSELETTLLGQGLGSLLVDWDSSYADLAGGDD